MSGLKVVTCKGDVLDLNRGLAKNATGYDMRQLFVEARDAGLYCRGDDAVGAYAQESDGDGARSAWNSAIMEALNAFQSALDLTAFEFFSDRAVQLVTARGDVASV